MSDFVLEHQSTTPLRSARLSGGGRVALALIGAIAMLAIFGPMLSSYAPDAINLGQRLQPPGFEHFLGTDHLGRDILSRLMAGARLSLGTVAITLSLIIVLGVAIGGASGFIGGRTDQIIMRITDVFLTFPTLVLALFMIGVLGTGLVNVIIAIALSHWAWYARMVRSIVLSLKHRDFILASRLAGVGNIRIFTRHLLPATLSQLIVLATLDIGHIMLHVSALSFLGLGIAPPAAEWGVMLSDARQYVWSEPYLMIWPGLALFITVMAFNLAGDALRDRLDPHLQMEHSH